MAKIGRNQPCPCGSGKKYKKCCLGTSKPETRPAVAPVPLIHPPPAYDAPQPIAAEPLMPPYVVAKIFERSAEFARMKQREPRRARQYWTPGRVAELAPGALDTRLRRLGVAPSEDAFVTQAEGYSSAWELSRTWLGGRGLSRHDDDFLGLAACELWKRYLPNRPSIEMLDDQMQQGYDSMMQQQPVSACEIWWEVWQTIHARLQPQMRTTDDAEVVFSGTQCLFNWVQDFTIELLNASLTDTVWAERGIQLCQQVLNQFSDERPNFRQGFRSDLGELHFRAGNDDKGEQVFLKIIEDFPDQAVGYANLAFALEYRAGQKKRPEDLSRALQLIEQALARPVSDAKKYDLASRLEDLRQQVAAQGVDDTERETNSPDS